MIDSRFGANALGAGGGNRTPRLPIGFGHSTIKLVAMLSGRLANYNQNLFGGGICEPAI
jgi:hypothetical protein